jgi:hypothetical protein
MTNIILRSRRHLLKTSLASLGVSAAGFPRRAAAIAPKTPAVAPVPSQPIAASPLAIAKAGLERVGARLAERDVVGIANFARPSAQPRLHLVDIAAGKVTTLLVAHGKGSDPNHTGWLTAFSNAPGSDATSQGAFLTGEHYDGAHGRSMRLIGLDPTNNNARERDIVVHSAWYVGQDIAHSHGMIGCSEGCFAVNHADLDQALTRLGPGRLLIAVKA